MSEAGWLPVGTRVRVADNATWQPCKTGTIEATAWGRNKDQYLISLDEEVVGTPGGGEEVVPAGEMPAMRFRPEQVVEVLA